MPAPQLSIETMINNFRQPTYCLCNVVCRAFKINEMDYKKKLDEIKKHEDRTTGCPSHNKMAFIGNYIFNFTTYDGAIDELFAKKMLEVIDCILNNKTFDYQNDEANYINYLTMVNMPFLIDKISWGTSIRGAWFDECGHHSDKQPAVYEIGCVDLVVPKIEIKDFMRQLIEWSQS